MCFIHALQVQLEDCSSSYFVYLCMYQKFLIIHKEGTRNVMGGGGKKRKEREKKERWGDGVEGGEEEGGSGLYLSS